MKIVVLPAVLDIFDPSCKIDQLDQLRAYGIKVTNIIRKIEYIVY